MRYSEFLKAFNTFTVNSTLLCCDFPIFLGGEEEYYNLVETAENLNYKFITSVLFYGYRTSTKMYFKSSCRSTNRALES